MEMLSQRAPAIAGARQCTAVLRYVRLWRIAAIRKVVFPAGNLPYTTLARARVMPDARLGQLQAALRVDLVYFEHRVLSMLTDRFDHSLCVLDSQRHRQAWPRSRGGSGDEPPLGLGSGPRRSSWPTMRRRMTGQGAPRRGMRDRLEPPLGDPLDIRSGNGESRGNVCRM